MDNRQKLVLELQGLDCANCAAKIEAKVKLLDEIKDASLNFINKTLTLNIKTEFQTQVVKEKATKIIKSFEPHVNVVELKDGNERNVNKEESTESIKKGLRLSIGVVFFIGAIFLNTQLPMKITLYLISYLLIGGDVILRAFKNIVKGQVFDENFLMTIATFGAFAIGEYPEGVAVMLFYQIGEMFQDMAVNKSRKSIKSLLDIKPEYANLKERDELRKVSPRDVKIGDVIVTKPGERVPLDGKVIAGASMVDTSALTGESVPRSISVGDDILSGFINQNGVLEIEVTKIFGESTVSKILDLVENASSKKAPTENFITKFAKYYTPFVVVIAVLLAVLPPILFNAPLSDWIYRALIFLVVSCPCALVISIPLGFFGGIGGASRKGILVKGGNYLEALNNVKGIVFDKTGTLTKGVFKATKIVAQNGFNEKELLRYAAFLESFSNHPIAVSIVKEFNENVDQSIVKDYEEVPGRGVKAFVEGKEILVGNGKLLHENSVDFTEDSISGTVVHVVIDRSYGGYIQIEDTLKDDTDKAIEELRKSGIENIVMLTGDNSVTAERISRDLKLDKVYSELLPDGKVEKLEELLQESSHKIAFVGDGINDAPVLARADVGIAMGGLGSDAAIEAADIVLMTDEPMKVAEAISIAKKTKRIVIQNIIFALGVKALVLLLGALGMATMWEAVFADVGVAVIAVLNSMRAMK